VDLIVLKTIIKNYLKKGNNTLNLERKKVNEIYMKIIINIKINHIKRKKERKNINMLLKGQ